jgi:putative hemolysin
MLILLVVVALVSAAESAFFSLTPTDMEELRDSGEKTDSRILDLINSPKRLLATVLISINFINIAIVVLSTFVMEELFDFTLNPLAGFLIQVIAVTFLILLIGEVIPKIYATQNPLKTSRLLLLVVLFLQRLFYPISSVLVYSTSLMDKIVKPKTHNISVDELSQALELTSDEDIPEEDHKILKGIVKFGHTDVKQIMKSRMDVTAFEYDTNYKKLLAELTSFGFSRVPIYKESLDNISGVLYAKDLLPYINEKDDFNWQKNIRPPFFVPENKKIDDLLREFQFKKIHLAIVVDEYGGTSGIVTLEDVIEEIVGEINDEFDDDDLVYSKLDDHNYVFEGKAHLNDVYRVLEIDGEVFEDAKGEADTLGGLLLELERRIPKKGEKIRFENMLFTIESADNRKIKRVKITIDRNEEESDDKE